MNDLLQAVFRAGFTFVTILVFANLFNRKKVDGLSFFDLVVAITVGGLASGMAGAANLDMWPIFGALVTVAGLAVLTKYVKIEQTPARKQHKQNNNNVKQENKISQESKNKKEKAPFEQNN